MPRGRYRLAPVRGWSRRRESGNPPGGMVADGGQVYLSGVPQEGTLAVSWIVNNQSQSCTLHFHLPDNPQQSLNTVKTVSGLCQTR
ncbi:type 1 fimbriae anchoring protein FimD [Klebsiella pneumoniae]|uniref:Type 1 fimbriae anchoring protein FimD n=1 Tax=Klebsiella pneumoniae TaxID=573 RepID=A0A3S5DH93_KLEPN|nr:type 1 fimbriae anchoring protein FimD [Klebsiella pneumoniae]